jgi:hypothetical protein
MVLIAGDGGHGKSTLTYDLAACLTTGSPCLGLDYKAMPPSDVLFVSCEDDFADTVVPRLLSAGADLKRVLRVDGVKTRDGKSAPFTLKEYENVEAELQANPNIRLVVIDPAGAYIGSTGVDDYNDSELRSLLGPLAELVAQKRVTIILIKHLIKGATTKAVHKVSGSVGYVNTVRAAFVLAPDKEDQDKKLFLPLKFNLGPPPSGLAFKMRSLDVVVQKKIVGTYGQHLDQEDRDRLAQQLFRIQWLGRVDAEADQVLSEQSRRWTSKVNKAAEWLEEFLAEYAYPSEEVFEAGKEAGFTQDNLTRAKGKLSGKIVAKCVGFQGKWWWGTGDPSTWNYRTAPWGPFPSTTLTDSTDSPDSGTKQRENR